MRYSQTLAAENFLQFVRSYDPDGNEYTAVSGYFDAWMRHGKAIEVTGGDHALFLRVFLLIADRFARSPDLFGKQEDPIKELLDFITEDGETNQPPDCLDPE